MADVWEWPRAVCVEYDARNAGHSVRDGDTFRVVADLGADMERRRLPVRLAGIDADELDDPDTSKRTRAYMARDFLRVLLPIGTQVALKSVGYDKYQPRVDAIVTRKSDGLEINKAMVDAGFAVYRKYLEEES